MPFPFLAVGAGLALANAAGRFFGGSKQTREAKRINPVWQQYQTNPFAKRQLALAQQLYGGRMPGASSMEKNVLSSQANYLNNVNRLATDSSQALSLGSAGLQQTDDALSDLQIREAQNKQNMLGNLNQAYQTMIGEGNKEYESMLQKYQMDATRKDALASSGAQNKYGSVGDLASMAFTLGTSGLGGGSSRANPNMIGSGGMNPTQYGLSVYKNLMNQKRFNPATGRFE